MKTADSFLRSQSRTLVVTDVDFKTDVKIRKATLLTTSEYFYQKHLNSDVFDKVFFDDMYFNGYRPSNVIIIKDNRKDIESITQSIMIEKGTQVAILSKAFVKLFLNYIKMKPILASFKYAKKLIEIDDEIEDLKSIDDKKVKKAKKEELIEIKSTILEAYKRELNSIPNFIWSYLSKFHILKIEQEELVLMKRQKSIYLAKEIGLEYGIIKKIVETGCYTTENYDNILGKTIDNERDGDPRQIKTSNFLNVLSQSLGYESIVNFEDDNEENKDVEKPLLKLQPSHITIALNSSRLSGTIFTEHGETLIKGSTTKTVRRASDKNYEEFLKTRQMAYYKDTYQLREESSSRFVEANLSELHKMLSQIGSEVDLTDIDSLKPLLEIMATGKRVDLPGQVSKTLGNYFAQKKYGYSIYNGEPGIGKTQVSFSVTRLLLKTVYKKGMKSVFICDGAKHLKKMVREAELILGEDAIIKVIRSNKDIDSLINDDIIEGKVRMYVVSKDTAKRSESFKNIPKLRKCPSCGARFVKKDVELIEDKNPKIKDHIKKAKIVKTKYSNKCSNCNDKLIYTYNKANLSGNFTWGKTKVKSKLVKEKGLKPVESFGKRLKRLLRNKKIIDFLIVDEAHGMTADTTAQTQMLRDFKDVSKKTMLMTGSLSNGYASSLYFLLYILMPKRLKEWGFDLDENGLSKWIDSYGARKKGNGGVQEKAVISASLMMDHLAPFTVWGKIEDLNYPMPRYSESVEVSNMEPEVLDALSKLQGDSKEIVERLSSTITDDGEEKERFISSGAVTKAMLYIANNPFKSYTIPFKYKGEVLETLTVPPVFDDESYLTNKEKDLLNLIDKNMGENRKVMVYTYFNKTAYANQRLLSVIEMNRPGVSVAVLPDSIKAENIEKWFLSAGVNNDVVIVPYKRVATGLDIPQFPEVIFYEEEYNIREIRQASRRPYRAVVQKKDVHINHLVYSGPQSIAMGLISEKIAASKVVEGETYTDEGVEAFAIDSIEIELQKRLAAGISELEVPDFATEVIEAGRARPWTQLEAEYIELLKELNEDAYKVAVPEFTEDIEVEDDVIAIAEEESIEIASDEIEEEIEEEESFVFSFEIIRNGKKVVKKGGDVEKDTLSVVKEELAENERIQLTFF